MRKVGQMVLLVGALMMATGFTLPYMVGGAISPAGYNVLQIGGIALALVGFLIRRAGAKTESKPAT
jgi:hypothetical protein